MTEGRFACVDALETLAEQLGAEVRWEVRGPDVILCVAFGTGRLEATPRGQRCEVRLRDVDLATFARVAALIREHTAGLAGAPAPASPAPRGLRAAGRLVPT